MTGAPIKTTAPTSQGYSLAFDGTTTNALALKSGMTKSDTFQQFDNTIWGLTGFQKR